MRCFSETVAGAKPTFCQIRDRVLKVCQSYDKLTADKVHINLMFCSQRLGCQLRYYSAKDPLSLKLISERVLLVLKLYDKVNPDKVRFRWYKPLEHHLFVQLFGVSF